MSDTLSQLLPSAVGVAISPLPIIAVVLMLVTARGRVNGPAFLLGWMTGLVMVGAVLLAVASGGDARERETRSRRRHGWRRSTRSRRSRRRARAWSSRH